MEPTGRGLLQRTPRTTSTSRLHPVFSGFDGSEGSVSPTSYWSIKTHTSGCGGGLASAMRACSARAASATGAGARRPTISSPPWAAVPTEVVNSEAKSSLKPTTGGMGAVTGGGCGAAWKRKLRPAEAETSVLLEAPTSGRERMCIRQSSSRHLASRACTPLDTEHAFK